MKTTTGSLVIRGALALSVLFMASLAASCKSPLFGLGGQVDTAVPSISVSEVEEGGTPRTLVNGDYVRGTITLRGKASDDLGLASVALSFEDNGATIRLDATIDAAAQSWSATVVTTDYLDGDKDFTVTVTDTAGKASTTRFVLYFDNKPPTVLLTVPSKDEGTASDALYGTIDIKGSAADQFGIRKVRVYVYDSNKTLLYTSPDDASIGTNSFALRLDTSSLLGESGAEIGYIYVRAWDRSGNTNVQFYRLDELKALNANLGATVEELHALETGSATSANGITLAQAAGARRYQPGTGYADAWLIGYSFDQSSNLPVITISLPDETKTAAENSIPTTAKAIGFVRDANGVAEVKVKFRYIDGSESDWYGDANIGTVEETDDLNVSGTGSAVNWSTKTLNGNYGGLTTGTQAIKVHATDQLGNVRESDWVGFNIDPSLPYIEITSPTSGSYLTLDDEGKILVSGTAQAFGTDNGITSIQITIDGTTYHNADSISGSGSVEWTKDIALLLAAKPDGNYTIKAKVHDFKGNEYAHNTVVIIDRVAPSNLLITSPARGQSVNGDNTLRGTVDDTALASVSIIIGRSKIAATPAGTLYSWSYSFDAEDYANTDYGFDMGDGRYRVPFAVQATDMAGNTTTSTDFGDDPDNPPDDAYYLDIFLKGDIPTITKISNPDTSTTIDEPYPATRSLKLYGTAFDDDDIHHIEMALVALYGDDDTESWRDLNDPTQTCAVGTYFNINGTVNWNWTLNESDELYNLADLSGHAGKFKILVRAVDTKDAGLTEGIEGESTAMFVRFDQTLPGVLPGSLTPSTDDIQRGIIPLSFTVTDNERISSVKISIAGSSYETLTPLAGWTETQQSFSYSINTATIKGGIFNNSSGTLSVAIAMTDSSGNSPTETFKYLVDNIVPVDVTAPLVASLKNDVDLGGDTHVAEVFGWVNDTGTVNGIKSVEVYFEREGLIYSIKSDGSATSTTAGVATDFTTGSGLYTDDTYYKITIDRLSENFNDINGDNDGYLEDLSYNSGSLRWYAYFSSDRIPDGDINVHYVIRDTAGNSRHCMVAGAIQNDPPTWTNFTIGTDLNGDGDSADDGERLFLERSGSTWSGYTLSSTGTQLGARADYNLATDTLFVVRNNRLAFTATLDCQNAPAAFTVTAPDGTTHIVSGAASPDFTETAFDSGAGWNEGDVETFSVSAIDSAFGTALSAPTLNLRVMLDNEDNTAPASTIERLSAADYATSGDERLGHIESWQHSPYDNYSGTFGRTEQVYGNDADISGTIIFSGTASDDQRISALRIWVDLNGDGAVDSGEEASVATFSGSGLLPAANALGTLTITGQSLDQDGHELSFDFEWNSASVSGGALADVAIRVTAVDAGGNVSLALPNAPTDTTAITAGFNTIKVDVVPYISEVSIQAPFTSRVVHLTDEKGWYPAFQGATGVVISGFNLPTTLGAGAVAIGSAQPAVTAAETDRTSLTMTLPSTLVSGAIVVTTNGIQSQNNANNNTQSWNAESETVGFITYALSDDRHIYIDDTTPSLFIAPFGRRYTVSADDEAKVLADVASYEENIGTDGGHVEYAKHSNFNNIIVIGISGTTITTSGVHGLSAGSMLQLKFSTAPATADGAINADDVFYVVSAPTTTTLTVAAAPGGAAIGFASAGSGVVIADPEASGWVVIRGKAHDDQRIKSIDVVISDFDGGNGSGNSFNLYSATTNASGVTTGSAKSGTEWAFVIGDTEDTADDEDHELDSTRIETGHAFNWSFAFNSANIGTVAATNVTVVFTIADYNNGATQHSVSASQTVDVVPYITDITNPSGKGLSNEVIRSSTGAYSIDVDTAAANVMTVGGFNLGSSSYAPSSYVSPAAITSPSGRTAATAFTSSRSIAVAKTMATTRSGYLTVFVNGVPSINNLNDNDASSAGSSYNGESVVSKPNSTLWNDDRYLFLWKATTVAPSVSNQTFYYPSMHVTGAGQPIFSYTNNNDGYSWRTTGDDSVAQRVGRWYARQASLAVNADGTYFIATAEDNFSGTNAGFLQVVLGDRNGTARINDGSTWPGITGVIELCGVEWDGTLNGGSADSRQLNRFMYPNIIATGNNGSTQLYVSYFDAHPDRQQIQFFAFKQSSATATNLSEPDRDYRIAGNGNLLIPGTKNASSQYTAMCLVGTDMAIAYYDATASKLKLAYSSNHTLTTGLANTAATWTIMTVDDSELSGSNVSMVSDGTNVYIAYNDGAESNLKMARVTWSTKETTTVVVDSYQSVGIWTNIALMNGLPYISYYNNSYNGTRSSIKVAYPIAGNGRTAVQNSAYAGSTASTNAFTGNWEVMNVPARTVPQGGKEEFTRTMIGSFTDSGQTLPVVAWLGTPRVEYGKLQPHD